MNSRFFLTVFITLIFHLGFSQNIIKNGTFKEKPKRTKSFKKSSSRLLNKKGEFTAKSKSNSMIKQSLMDFNGQYRMQNFFLSTGLTFMLPNSLENEFSKRGRLGLIFEGGAYHIFERGGNIFNYMDYGAGYKRLSGSEFNDVNNKSIFKQNYISSFFNINNIWQLSSKNFLQSSIGANLDFKFFEKDTPLPNNTDKLNFSFHFKLGYGIKFRKTLFIIPTIETPIINLKKWEQGKSTFGIFNSRYRPVLFKVRFIWLKKLGKSDCPPVYTNPEDDARNERNYMQ
jgi:hypothetical protein